MRHWGPTDWCCELDETICKIHICTEASKLLNYLCAVQSSRPILAQSQTRRRSPVLHRDTQVCPKQSPNIGAIPASTTQPSASPRYARMRHWGPTNWCCELDETICKIHVCTEEVTRCSIYLCAVQSSRPILAQPRLDNAAECFTKIRMHEA